MLSAVALALLGTPAAGSCPDPGVAVLSEDVGAIELLVQGGQINDDCTHLVSAGQDWVLELTIVTTNGAQDELDLSGTLRHVNAAHLEGPNASGLPIAIHVDAGDLPGGVHAIPFTATLPHGNHDDELNGTLTVEVFFEEIFDFHFVFDYSVEISGRHVAPVPALPFGWVLAAGLSVVLGGALVLARRG